MHVFSIFRTNLLDMVIVHVLIWFSVQLLFSHSSLFLQLYHVRKRKIRLTRLKNFIPGEFISKDEASQPTYHSLKVVGTARNSRNRCIGLAISYSGGGGFEHGGKEAKRKLFVLIVLVESMNGGSKDW